MSTLRILHTADLHLDSPFEGLSSGKASVRRGEQRELFRRITALAAEEKVDIVLISGDLFDGDTTYYETGDILTQGLKTLGMPVFIAPGNHDYYRPGSPYEKLKFPENVHIFTSGTISCVELPELHCRVYGAAFTDSRSKPLLAGFKAEETPGVINLMCIHGVVDNPTSIYDPITREQLAASGLNYCALGHEHRATGLLREGNTWYSQPGCPEGRGFDELGEKTVNIIELDDSGECRLKQAAVSSRKYCVMEVGVTSTEPLLAIHTQLPDDTMSDIYRIILTGECETVPDLAKLYRNLEEIFFSLQIIDETHPPVKIWEHAGEDTLCGIFLEKMKAEYDRASDIEKPQIEKAVRWGLAAIYGMEEVAVHEN